MADTLTDRFTAAVSGSDQLLLWLVITSCALAVLAPPAMASDAPQAQPELTTTAHPDGPTPTAGPPLAASLSRQADATNIGSVYCGTGVEAGIDVGFGAIAGLGLPLVGIYLVVVGIKYLRASTEQQKKQAKNSLTTAAFGFAIIVLALLSPELIDKVGTEVGFSFSDCVRPF